MKYILVIWAMLFIIVIIYAINYWRKPKIQACHLKDFDCIRKSIHSKKVSDKEKIIDYDKLYHKILLKSGYQWGFGDILKQKPPEVHNLNKIWELHKVRNLLVHEIGYPKWVSLFKVADEYKQEINSLLKTFKK